MDVDRGNPFYEEAARCSRAKTTDEVSQTIYARWQAIPYYELGEVPESLPEQSTELEGFVGSLPVDFYRLITIKRALVDSYEDAEDDPEIGVIDMLVDLRHLCDALGLDFAKLDRRAYGYYAEEKREFPEGKTNA